MIRELVELGERLRLHFKTTEGLEFSDAWTTDETVETAIVIAENGDFIEFLPIDSKPTIAEDIVVRTRAPKPRLLLDGSKYVLGRSYKKQASKKKIAKTGLEEFTAHEEPEYLFAFQEKLSSLTNVRIKPVIAFYKKESGYPAAIVAFNPSRQSVSGNFGFLVGDNFLHCDPTVLASVDAAYKENISSYPHVRCSVCAQYGPVPIDSHGPIKNAPAGQTSGTFLVSYNEAAFISYRLTGNLNAQICCHCAKSYRQALNWLLAPSGYTKDVKGKGHPFYNNRYDLGKDTASVFWTRRETTFNPKAVLEKKSAAEVKALFDSVRKGKSSSLSENDFYAITLSGSSARVMVRDFIHTSVEAVQRNLQQWFKDIDIGRKDGAGVALYSPLWRMAESTRRPRDSRRNDVTPARVQLLLWKAAVQGAQVPLWALHAVISRLRMDSYKLGNKKKEGSGSTRPSDRIKKAKDADSGTLTFGQVFKPERIALIQLVLKRITRGEEDMSQQAANRREVARIYGKIFAVLAKIQYYAAQRDVNVGVVNRHYSAASTTPASAFGRLFKNSRHHLEKIKASNKGLAINLDKELSTLMAQIGDEFLPVLSLEDQGLFALGFYQQRSEDFHTGQIDEELENAGDGDETDGSIEEENLE